MNVSYLMIPKAKIKYLNRIDEELTLDKYFYEHFNFISKTSE